MIPSAGSIKRCRATRLGFVSHCTRSVSLGWRLLKESVCLMLEKMHIISANCLLGIDPVPIDSGCMLSRSILWNSECGLDMRVGRWLAVSLGSVRVGRWFSVSLRHLRVGRWLAVSSESLIRALAV